MRRRHAHPLCEPHGRGAWLDVLGLVALAVLFAEFIACTAGGAVR